MRLIFFGDSLTTGEYGGAFVPEVARLLPRHEIVNAGEGGNTVVNLLHRLDRDVLARQPDGVFVMVGGNDVISCTMPLTRNYYRRNRGGPDGVVTPALFAQTYRELLTRLQLAQVLTWVGLEPVEYSPEIVDAMRRFNDEAREAASSLSVPALDLMDVLPPLGARPRPELSTASIRLIGQRLHARWSDYELERAREGFTFTFDGFHVTPDAARRMARAIVEFLDL